MGLRNWLAKIGHAVDAEYDRRIKRASGVTEYGIHVHEHADDTEEANIANIPPGTLVREVGTDSPPRAS